MNTKYNVKELADTAATGKRFKFQSFTERIKHIDVDVFHKVEPVELAPQQADSFFRQQLLEWEELNYTSHFTAFVQEINPLIQSLPQILYNKDRIMSILLAHLSVRDSTARKALLQLTATLARDLRQHFVPFYKDVLHAATKLLNPSDPELVEDIFATLGYLLKFLQRQLLQDLSQVFIYYEPLLAHSKAFLRHFAAEGFAFLLRKVEGVQRKELIRVILTSITDSSNDAFCDGIAHVFLETVKGVKGRLHSRSGIFFSSLLAEATCETAAKKKIKVIEDAFKLICAETKPQYCHPLWEALFSYLAALFEQPDSGAFAQGLRVGQMLSIMASCLSVGRAKTIFYDSSAEGSGKEPPLKMLFDCLELVCNQLNGERAGWWSPDAGNDQLVRQPWTQTLELFASLLSAFGDGSSNSSLNWTQGSTRRWTSLVAQIRNAIMRTEDCRSVFQFCHCMKEEPVFSSHFLPFIPNYCDTCLRSNSKMSYEDTLMEVLMFLVDLQASPSLSKETLRFSAQAQGVTSMILSNIADFSERDRGGIFRRRNVLLSLALAAVSSLDIMQTPAFLEELRSSILKVFDTLLGKSKLKEDFHMEDDRVDDVKDQQQQVDLFLVSQCLRAYLHCLLQGPPKSYEETIAVITKTLSLLKYFPQAPHLLRSTHSLLSEFTSSSIKASSISKLFSEEKLLELIPYLERGLSSNDGDVRSATAGILSAFRAPSSILAEDSTNILDLMRTIETTEANISTERRIIRLTTVITGLVVKGQVSRQIKPLILHFLLGRLHVKFSALWGPTKERLKECAEIDFLSFWPVFLGKLRGAHCSTLVTENAEQHPSPMQEESCSETFLRAVDWFAQQLHHQVRSTEQVTYHCLLWDVMASIAPIAEPRSRDFVPLFLGFMSREYTSLVVDLPIPSEGVDQEIRTNYHPSKAQKKANNTLLLRYLQFFSRINNPKSMFAALQLHAIFIRLLYKGQSEIQKLALACLLTWKHDYLISYKEHLERLIAEHTFRQELTTFPVDREKGFIADQHRAKLIPVLIKILYGKLITRRGRSAKNSPAARRATIMAYLAGLEQDELLAFMALITKPFAHILSLFCNKAGSGPGTEVADEALVKRLVQQGVKSDQLEESVFNAAAELNRISISKQTGFLRLLHEVFSKLGARVQPYLSIILSLLLVVIKAAITQDRPEIEKEALRRLGEMLDVYPSFDFRPFLPFFFSTMNAELEALPNKSIQHPSPLLRCLFATTCHPELLYILEHQPRAIHQIVSCFAQPNTCSETTLLVMDLLQNLLTFALSSTPSTPASAAYSSNGDGMDLLSPHLSHVLTSIGLRPDSVNTDPLFARKLRFLSNLGPLITDPSQTQQLVDVLLPQLAQYKGKRAIAPELRSGILTIFRHGMQQITSLGKYIPPLAALFSTTTGQHPREELCLLFHELATYLPELKEMVAAVADLNTYSTTALDTYDYDKRINAFAVINDQLLKSPTFGEWDALLAVHNCVFFMQDSDMAIRTTASYSASQLVQHTASNNPVLHRQIVAALIPFIKTFIKSSQPHTRKEFLLLFSVVISCSKSTGFDFYSDLDCINGDPENFFKNICHIQVHKQIKALQQLRAASQEGCFTKNTIQYILVPLVMRLIYEGDVLDNNITDEAARALGSLVGQLAWGGYYSVFCKVMRQLPRRTEIEKPLLKALCSIIDYFHFASPNLRAEESMSVDTEEEKSIAANLPQQSTNPETEASEQQFKKIDQTFRDKVLPELYKYLENRRTEEEGMVLRHPLAIAIVKILKIFPKLIPTQLPSVLFKVCNNMKNRLESERDNTRATLKHICNILGPTYFLFIIQQLQGTLRRGFELHVLGYTVHYLLVHMLQHHMPANGDEPPSAGAMEGEQPTTSGSSEDGGNKEVGDKGHGKIAIHTGDLDDSLTLIVDILVQEMLGDVGKQKEVESVTRKLKEARKTQHTYHAFEICARLITFRSDTVHALLQPLKAALEETTSLKAIAKIEEALRNIAHGIEKNDSVTSEQLLVFLHTLIKTHCMSGEQQYQNIASEAKAKELRFLVQAQPAPSTKPKRAKLQRSGNMHVIAEFGLMVLLAFLKREKLSTQNLATRQMLDPFATLLIRFCMKSQYNNTLVLTLKCLCFLLRIELPTLHHANVQKLTKRTLSLLKKSAARSELQQTCFKMLTVIIRHCDNHTITEAQLRALLVFANNDLDELENHARTFNLLKVILSRKLVVSEIYDLMIRLSELMLQSQAPAIRQQCSFLFLQFLLHYPLGKDRLKQHLSFLVKNLSFVHETGRLAALDMLRQICLKFPQAILDDYSEFFMLPLVMRLINDDSQSCRQAAGQVLKALFLATHPNVAQQLLSVALHWFESDASHQQHQESSVYLLKRASVQLLGLFVEAAQGTSIFDKHAPAVMNTAMTLVSKEATASPQSATSQAANKRQWELLYYALVLLEKIFVAFPNILSSLIVSEQMNELWNSTCKALLHHHLWIRLAAARLFGLYFSHCRQIGEAEAIINASAAFSLAKVFCQQLYEEHLSPDLGEQVVKNLLFVGAYLYQNPSSSSSEHNTTSSKVASIEEEEEEEEEKEEDIEQTANGCYEGTLQSLHWLFRRLSFLSRTQGPLTKTCVFKWFGAMATTMLSNDLEPFLIPMIAPMYRTINEGSNKQADAAALATEVMDLVREKVGHMVFMKAQNEVRSKVDEQRAQRKRKRALLSLLNPEAAAQKRHQHNKKQMDRKKRKRPTRAPGSSIKVPHHQTHK
ncbi:U3 snoRNP protein [Balamuthia mandrillaris]